MVNRRLVRAGALAGGRGNERRLCEALATKFEFFDGAGSDKANTTLNGVTFSGAFVRPRKDAPSALRKPKNAVTTFLGASGIPLELVRISARL